MAVVERVVLESHHVRYDKGVLKGRVVEIALLNAA
jgi:hypothetical protein